MSTARLHTASISRPARRVFWQRKSCLSRSRRRGKRRSPLTKTRRERGTRRTKLPAFRPPSARPAPSLLPTPAKSTTALALSVSHRLPSFGLLRQNQKARPQTAGPHRGLRRRRARPHRLFHRPSQIHQEGACQSRTVNQPNRLLRIQ